MCPSPPLLNATLGELFRGQFQFAVAVFNVNDQIHNILLVKFDKTNLATALQQQVLYVSKFIFMCVYYIIIVFIIVYHEESF